MAAIIALNAAETRAETVLPFRTAGAHAVVVPVYLDGRGPFDFLLDTGASSTLVHSNLAAVLGLVPEDRVLLVTAAGSRAVPRTRVGVLGFGPHAGHDVEILISPLEEVRTESGAVQGVLGQNLLSRFSFALDYRRRCVRFGADRSAPTGTRLPVQVDEGRAVVTAKAGRRGDRSLRLVLDSALSGPVLFEKRGRPLGLEGTRDHVVARTEAGTVLVRTARLPALQLGAMRLDDLTVAVVDDETAGGRTEDGLLPTSLFGLVYFDSAAGFARVEPR